MRSNIIWIVFFILLSIWLIAVDYFQNSSPDVFINLLQAAFIVLFIRLIYGLVNKWKRNASKKESS
ncbi:hypothetical protein ACGTN9_11000 [Halobacillus sp. MO56]